MKRYCKSYLSTGYGSSVGFARVGDVTEARTAASTVVSTAASTVAPKLSGRGAARRSELFDDLVALLLREGFARFTLDELAARLHCSKRTLYGLASSKEQLVRAAVVHFFRNATARVEAALAAEVE